MTDDREADVSSRLAADDAPEDLLEAVDQPGAGRLRRGR